MTDQRETSASSAAEAAVKGGDYAKPRRVGTFTMGISLIFVGTAIIISFFSTTFNIVTAAKFAPIILIIIGIEILVKNFIYKDDKIKYDFLSIFVCSILIFGSLLVSCIPLCLKYYGPERDTLQRELSHEVYDECYNVLKGEEISNFDAVVNINQYDYDKDMKITDLTSSDDVDISVQLSGQFENPTAFAEKCKEILSKMNSTEIKFNHVEFNCENNNSSGKNYSLSLDDKFQFDMSAGDIEKHVSED